MMKIWLVVYIFNEVAMTVGPLPYDKVECEVVRLVKQEETDAIFRGYGGKLPERDHLGRDVTFRDVRTACIESDDRPH